MSDIEKRDYIPSTSRLSKLGITAVGYTAGGVFLFLLQAFARFRGLGIVVGALVCIIGIGSFTSKDPADKKAGAIIMTAGILALLSRVPPVAPVAGTLLAMGAFGLLAMGIINGVKFFTGLKKRS
jgi:Fe2+ transport system protein FeoA